MSNPHRYRYWPISAMRVARAVAWCATSLALVGASTDLASADDATGAALPRFVDAQGLDSLRHALVAPSSALAAPPAPLTTEAIMPRFAGTAASGNAASGNGASGNAASGHGAALPLTAPAVPGQPRQATLAAPVATLDSDITTSHFQQTLKGARREAGETRELADEVRRRAEELTERFAGGSDQPGNAGSLWASKPSAEPSQAPAASADEAAAPSTDNAALLLPEPPPPGVAPAKVIDQTAALDRSEDDTAPVAGLPLSVDTSFAPLRAEARPRDATPARTKAADPASKDARGGRSKSGKPKSAGDAGATRLSGREGIAPRRAGFAAANAAAAAGPKSAISASLKPRPPAAEKPASAAAVAQPAQVSQSEPAPAPKSQGGLLSWLKPFAFPKEIGAFGWSTGD